jgi:hypothetical protein
MSDPLPSRPDPTPFAKFTEFARRLIAVPKAEADEKEKEWREERDKANPQKKREARH